MKNAILKAFGWICFCVHLVDEDDENRDGILQFLLSQRFTASLVLHLQTLFQYFSLFLLTKLLFLINDVTVTQEKHQRFDLNVILCFSMLFSIF